MFTELVNVWRSYPRHMTGVINCLLSFLRFSVAVIAFGTIPIDCVKADGLIITGQNTLIAYVSLRDFSAESAVREPSIQVHKRFKRQSPWVSTRRSTPCIADDRILLVIQIRLSQSIVWSILRPRRLHSKTEKTCIKTFTSND